MSRKISRAVLKEQHFVVDIGQFKIVGPGSTNTKALKAEMTFCDDQVLLVTFSTGAKLIVPASEILDMTPDKGE